MTTKFIDYFNMVMLVIICTVLSLMLFEKAAYGQGIPNHIKRDIYTDCMNKAVTVPVIIRNKYCRCFITELDEWAKDKTRRKDSIEKIFIDASVACSLHLDELKG